MKQILLPGGELEPDILTFLNKVGFNIDFKPRCYCAKSKTLPVEFVIVRASSIPEIINDPKAQEVIGGITGSDILTEAKTNLGKPLAINKFIPNFKPSILYLGVNKNNSNSSLAGKTIATKYPNTARLYFLEKEIPVSLYFAPGKDEAIPYLRKDVVGVFGIKKTEKTLRANNLQIIDEVGSCSINWIRRPTIPETSFVKKVEFMLLQ